jgi:hypothetical protein
VVVKDTTVTAKDVPGGSELTVKAKKAGDVQSLQRESKDRAQKFGAVMAALSASATPSAAPSASAKPPTK